MSLFFPARHRIPSPVPCRVHFSRRETVPGSQDQPFQREGRSGCHGMGMGVGGRKQCISKGQNRYLYSGGRWAQMSKRPNIPAEFAGRKCDPRFHHQRSIVLAWMSRSGSSAFELKPYLSEFHPLHICLITGNPLRVDFHGIERPFVHVLENGKGEPGKSAMGWVCGLGV